MMRSLSKLAAGAAFDADGRGAAAVTSARVVSLIAIAVAGALTASPARAAAAPADCSKDPHIPAVAKAWKAATQPPPFTISLADAPCFRNALLSKLSLGPIVGYKIGVYSKGARASYNTDRPAVGVLTRDMLQPEGKPVSARFGFMPLAEADFLAIVGDDGLNDARTPDEAYEHISGYRPFIEMPDLQGEKSNFARLNAFDVGARKGAMGPEFKLPRTQEARLALRDMTVETTIETPEGVKKTSVQAKELQGDLMQVVLDARDLLRAEGIRLKKGDVLSLGTLTPYHPPVAGEKFTVTYKIGDATYTIRQDFTP